MKLITGHDLQEYFLEHVKPAGADWRFKVTKPLHVFKKVWVGWYIDGKPYYPHAAIANLIVPIGALVVIDDRAFMALGDDYWGRNRRKMRASSAEVHSIVRTHPRGEVSWAVSKHDKTFNYRPGDRVLPTRKFDRSNEQCSSGIHFFLNVQDALDW